MFSAIGKVTLLATNRYLVQSAMMNCRKRRSIINKIPIFLAALFVPWFIQAAPVRAQSETSKIAFGLPNCNEIVVKEKRPNADCYIRAQVLVPEGGHSKTPNPTCSRPFDLGRAALQVATAAASTYAGDYTSGIYAILTGELVQEITRTRGGDIAKMITKIRGTDPTASCAHVCAIVPASAHLIDFAPSYAEVREGKKGVNKPRPGDYKSCGMKSGSYSCRDDWAKWSMPVEEIYDTKKAWCSTFQNESNDRIRWAKVYFYYKLK